MSVLELLIFQARRHCLSKPSSHLLSSSLLGTNRSLSSSSNSTSESNESEVNPPPPESPGRPSQSVPIQPVSYSVKPKDQSSPDSNPSPDESLPNPRVQRPREPTLSSESEENRRVWTREDIRYVKNVPSVSISPVSYPSRVAPLPEDKVLTEVKGEVQTGADGTKESAELEQERKRIEADGRARRSIFRVVEEQKTVVPFPSLLKPNKKEKPVILDLVEAIRQVKVGVQVSVSN